MTVTSGARRAFADGTECGGGGTSSGPLDGPPESQDLPERQGERPDCRRSQGTPEGGGQMGCWTRAKGRGAFLKLEQARQRPAPRAQHPKVSPISAPDFWDADYQPVLLWPSAGRCPGGHWTRAPRLRSPGTKQSVEAAPPARAQPSAGKPGCPHLRPSIMRPLPHGAGSWLGPVHEVCALGPP